MKGSYCEVCRLMDGLENEMFQFRFSFGLIVELLNGVEVSIFNRLENDVRSRNFKWLLKLIIYVQVCDLKLHLKRFDLCFNFSLKR